MKFQNLLLTCGLSLAAICAIAQPKYISKYGKVSLEELRMERYEPDSGASAVILFDRGRLNGNTGAFTRHVRLKVLTSAGTSRANFQIRTPSRSNIDGIAFNLVDGQIVESELKKENIHREKIVDDYEVFKVFFPNVKPGTVIDLRYSFSGLPTQWRFQDRIPVMYSELILEPTQFIQFKKALYGKAPVKADGNMKWIAEAVPAFEEEPFMTHYSNYVTHFKFDILRIGVYEISSTWEKLGHRLWEADHFGGILRNSPFLNEKAKELKNSSDPAKVKIEKAFHYIQENIKWNGLESSFASEEYWGNFTKNHSGNSGDVNLLLTALLRKAGLEAYPALVSTRDNGLLNPASASLTSINFVVACVKDGENELLLDATSPYLIPGVISIQCRNTSAYVVNDDKGWWIDTTKGRPFSRRQFIQIQLDENGGASGNVNTTYEDYDYLNWLDGYNEAGSDDAFVSAMKAKTTDMSVTKCAVNVSRDKLQAVETVEADLTGTQYVEDLGNEILVNPFLFNDIENPFKSEKRDYPVDFISSRKRSVIISMKIPSNMSVAKFPETALMVPECGGAKFVYQSGLTGNVLSIRCTLLVDRTLFTEDQYGALQGFFSAVNRKLSEAVQLQKKI